MACSNCTDTVADRTLSIFYDVVVLGTGVTLIAALTNTDTHCWSEGPISCNQVDIFILFRSSKVHYQHFNLAVPASSAL